MQTFKNILVPTDFSEPAEQATELAILLAQKFDSKLTLLHAYEIPSYPYADGLYWPLDDLIREAKTTLDAALAKVKERYANVEAVLGSGNPFEQILTVAKDRSCDLIAMGTHGRRGLSRIFLGSVAERVVRLSPVPVLTVGPRGADERKRG
jgi:nucleotide-binding universal stress UspA family protein